MKDETTVFALALELHGTPWQVQEINLNAPNKKLTIRLDFARGSRFPHPKTGELCRCTIPWSECGRAHELPLKPAANEPP
ncbi:MAG: hypothetical protein Q7S40_14800 [Opitutaceae bacterium]|nr:hypothetical protein [Opitutaceae bacterium]